MSDKSHFRDGSSYYDKSLQCLQFLYRFITVNNVNFDVMLILTGAPLHFITTGTGQKLESPHVNKRKTNKQNGCCALGYWEPHSRVRPLALS